MTLLSAIAVTLLVGAGLAALLVGLGLLLAAPAALACPEGERAWAALWIGFTGVLLFLQVWQLFLPVGGACLAVLAAASALGWWLARAALPGRTVMAPSRAQLGMLAAASAWLAWRALGPPVGDSGLYHLSQVRWFSEYRLPPGLANLHERLGFNNPSLLWSALLEVGPGRGRSSHFALLPLVAATLARGLLGLARLARRGSGSPRDLFHAAVLAVPVMHAVTLFELRVSSPDPDAFVGLGAIAVTGFLLPRSWGPPARQEPAQADAWVAGVIAACLGCLKLSAVPFAGAALAVSFLRLARGAGALRRCGSLAAVVAGLAVPWLARGIVTSGFAAFPAPWLRVEALDWSVPASEASRWLALVREYYMPPVAWALAHGQPVRGWLAWQLTRCPELVLVPTALALGAGVALARRARGPGWQGTVAASLPSMSGLLVWALMAPAPRFAYGFIWSAAAVLVVAAMGAGVRPRPGALVAALALLAALVPVHRCIAFAVAGRWAEAGQVLVLPPGPDLGFHPTPRANLGEEVTASGLRAWVPVQGDATWDAPLPATPGLHPDLRERVPGDLGAGFSRRGGEERRPGT